MLKVVSLDVGGTLIDFYYANYVWNVAIPQLYARKKDISFEEAKDYVLREYDSVGSNDIRWYLPEYWFKHFDLDEDPIEVFRSHIDKVRFYPEVPSVLKNLSQKYDLIIVSGTPRNVIEIVIEGFRNYFKHIFSSVSDRQEVKKMPQFYEMICKVLGIETLAMVHVGDEWYYDFIAPRRIGVKSFFLDRTGEKSGKFVIKDLRELEDRLANL
ncbi:MAG: HAD family hydrolase [Candidatus Bathyarchaeota archaeon]|nr:HAD family hydrolase [Candidatus Bathyarchaeota archaeon]